MAEEKHMDNTLAAMEIKIKKLREHSEEQQKQLKEYENQVATLKAEIDNLSKLVHDMMQEDKSKKDELAALKQEIEEMKRKMQNTVPERSGMGGDEARPPKPSVNDFADDVLVKIITLVPKAQWPSLERVSRGFRSAVHKAWGSVEEIKINKELVTEDKLKNGGIEMVNMILDKLLKYAPNLKSIGGFRTSNKKWPDASMVERLTRMTQLDSIDFTGVSDSNQLALFLKSSTGRHLKKLVIASYYLRPRGSANCEELQSALGQLDGLEQLISDRSFNLPDDIFDLVDSSMLTTLNVARTPIDPLSLTSMIRGASLLENLAFSFVACDAISSEPMCRAEHRLDNQRLIRAVAGAENLLSLEIAFSVFEEKKEAYFPDLHTDRPPRRGCLYLEGDLVRMVHEVARRGRLLKISIDEFMCTDNVANAIKWNMGRLTSLEATTCVLPLPPEWTTLKSLKVSGSIEDSSAITHLATLESLHLSDCRLTIDLGALIAMPNLRELRVEDCQVPLVTAPSSSARLEALGLVALYGAEEPYPSIVNDPLMINFVKNLPDLRFLNLSNSEITDATLEAVASSCPRLEILKIEACDAITAKGVRAVVSGCKQLKEIFGIQEIYDISKIAPYRIINQYIP